MSHMSNLDLAGVPGTKAIDVFRRGPCYGWQGVAVIFALAVAGIFLAAITDPVWSIGW